MAMLSKEALNEKDAVGREESFKKFMAQTTIRILISKMPSTEPELLEALLKEAHDKGWNCGSGHNAAMFIEVLMRQDRNERK